MTGLPAGTSCAGVKPDQHATGMLIKAPASPRRARQIKKRFKLTESSLTGLPARASCTSARP
jgi:hypothetical protein